MITIRAALAVALLGGYWLGRYLVVGCLVVLTVWRWVADLDWSAGLLTLVTALAVVLQVRAASVVRRCAAREPVGTVVPRRSDSPLWSEVCDLCARLDVRPPDEIRLGTEPTVEVWEQPTRYGLLAGPRHLHLGLPLLVGMDAGQLKALLAHELAHDWRDAGRLRAVCHRARTTVGTVVARRPRTAGVVFAVFGRMFLALQRPASRDQEWRADRAAVRLTSRASLASALRELPGLAVAWRRYVAEVIAPAVRSGYAPLSLGDGFAQVRDGWGDVAGAPASARLAWDAHPPLVERLHAIELAPETHPGPGTPSPWSPRQLPAIAEVERQVIGADVRRVPWEEFCAIAASESLRDEVSWLFQAAGAEGLDAVLALIEAGGLPQLVSRLASPATVRRLLAVAFAQAAVDGGIARWRQSRSGALQAVRTDGAPVPVDELAARVVADPSTVSVVRDVLKAVQVAHARP